MTKALASKRRVYLSPDNVEIVVEQGSNKPNRPVGDKLKPGVAV